MIKLIMSDMDGTLLDENGNLPPDFDAVMEELKARGILFAPASGRQYYALLRQFQKYENDFIFVAENGTCGMREGKTLFYSAMDPAVVREMLGVAKKIPQAQVVLCGRNSAYILSEQEPIFMQEVGMYYARCKMVDDFDQVEDDILKISLCDLSEGGSEFNAYPHFVPYKGRQQVVVSSRLWMDVMNMDVNKGIAAKRIQELLGILPVECMVFGDYMNDYEMMSSAYYSYAMENAHPKIKEAARFQARSNRAHGVTAAIRDMLRTSL